MNSYRALMRRRLLEQMYDSLSEEDKRLYVRLSMQDKDSQEILDAIRQQHRQLEEIQRKQNWLTDFGSDVAANFFTDGIIWLGTKLLKRF